MKQSPQKQIRISQAILQEGTTLNMPISTEVCGIAQVISPMNYPLSMVMSYTF
ncbi:hypothetical protein FKM82_006741 [Ascaphus truei]